MNLIKLTSVQHPDISGRPEPCYIDSERIIGITRARTAFTDHKSTRANREAVDALYDEVRRVVDESRRPLPIVPDSDKEARELQRTVDLREAAAALNAAYGLVLESKSTAVYHPEIDVTKVDIGCGTVEQFVMLSHYYVTETPDEVAKLIVFAAATTR